VNRFWLLLLGLAAIALLGYLALQRACRDDPVPIVTPDTLPDQVLEEQRPKPPTTLPQKIVKHGVKPRVTTSQGKPDTLLVRRFAAAVALADSLRRSYTSLRDSLEAAGEPAPPPPALPSILPAAWGQYRDNGEFTLWMSRSDGAILRATAKLRPNFSFVAGVDQTTTHQPAFYEDRAWVRTLRQLKKCGPPAGVVAGVGAITNADDRLLGAVIAGGATLVGCLVG
jgi:hypothetical protein